METHIIYLKSSYSIKYKPTLCKSNIVQCAFPIYVRNIKIKYILFTDIYTYCSPLQLYFI